MNPQKVKLLALGVLLALSVTVQLAYASQPVPSMYADPSNQQSELASAQDTTAVAPSQYFIAIFSLGPAWQSDKPAHEQLYFKEHSANFFPPFWPIGHTYQTRWEGRLMPSRLVGDQQKTAGSMPILSLTAHRGFCLHPGYRSIVWMETWPRRNCI